MPPGAATDALPPGALALLRRAAAESPDGKTVTLVFATHEFISIILGFNPCSRRVIGIRVNLNIHIYI